MKSGVQLASSSDSEDDEERIRLAQALDPDFMKNVRNTKADQLINGGGVSEGPPVSKRSKLFDSSVMETEFVKPYSLDVTPEGQRFIAKQLAKSLEKSIKEKPLLSPSPPCSTADTGGIKLFASSNCRLTQNDLLPLPPPKRRPLPTSSSSSKKKKKHKKKKSTSKSSSSSSSSSSDSDSDKLKSVAVSSEWVLQQK